MHSLSITPHNLIILDLSNCNRIVLESQDFILKILDNKAMNNRLRELRLETGLTQKELAKQLGSTDKNIWAYEKGNVNPPMDILIAYSNFFGVSVDYLLGLENDYGAKVAAPMGETLTASEKELLSDFRKLSPYLQGIAINTVRGLTGAGAGDLHKKA